MKCGFEAWVGIVGILTIWSTSPSLAQSHAMRHPTSGRWYAVLPEALPWHEARQAAIDLGGDLATPTSVAANEFILQLLTRGDYASGWLGGFQDPMRDSFAEPSGGWRWTDGSPIEFAMWGLGEPNNRSNIEHHLEARRVGRWNDNSASSAAIVEWSADCNGDGIVDLGQILAGSLTDSDANGVPDCCEDGRPCLADCDGDGISDLEQILSGDPDCDGDGVPDSCGVGRIYSTGMLAPFDAEHALVKTLRGVDPAEADVAVTVSVRADLVGEQRYVVVWLDGVEVAVLWQEFGPTCSATPATTTVVVPARVYNEWVQDGSLDVVIEASTAMEGGDCSGSMATVSIRYRTPLADCDRNGVPDACEIAAGVLEDCNGNGIPDPCEQFQLDCDGNGVSDVCDLAAELASDCDRNGWLDHCDLAELPGLDCNGNGSLDACDLVAGIETDCNVNGRADTCDGDCDADGVADACAIASGLSTDCNDNGVPDACEVAMSGMYFDHDCDRNGVHDACQIQADAALDGNSDGMLDACQLARGDLNLDGMIDGSDLAAMLGVWGASDQSVGDLTEDGSVDGADLAILIGNWGPYRRPWGAILEWTPDPSVVSNPMLLDAIVATGLPWRVRDEASGVELLLVPAGTFLMGCSSSLQHDCRPEERPVHQVTLTRPFYLGRYEVTQAQWEEVMGSRPSEFWGDDRPVERVNWIAIQEFEAITGLRLPTEAEWEYACRAGTTTAFSNGSDDDLTLKELAWYSLNSGVTTHRVGMKQPNALGLFDMHGNVAEKCEDIYRSDYYSYTPSHDPPGPTGSPNSPRSQRGGAWGGTSSLHLRTSSRGALAHFFSNSTSGFRAARIP